MTVAVCVRCGAFKHGAWSACSSCSYDPTGDGLEVEAQSLWLTDHHRTLAQLQEDSERIKQKLAPAFDESFIEQATSAARAEGRRTMIPSATGCLRMVLPMVVVFLGLAGLVAWWVMR